MNSKWWTIALAVSLALNLALTGFIIGRYGTAAGWLDVNRELPHALRALPPERREMLAPQMRAHLRALRSGHRNLRGANDAVRAALSADPFQPDQLRNALQQLRDDQSKVLRASHDSLVELVGQMSPIERRELAGAMTRPRHGPFRRPAPELQQ